MARLGWKTGMLIFAGIMLTCILFGAIMRPLKPIRVPIKQVETELHPVQVTEQRDKLSSPPPTYQESAAETSVPLLSGGDASARPSNSAMVPTDVHDIATVSSTPSQKQPIRARTVSSSSHASSIASGGQRTGVPNPDDAARPLYKKDVFLGSAYKLNQRSRTSLHSNPYMASVTNIPQAIDDLKKDKKKESTLSAFMDILVAMLDFSILKNKQMLLICIGNIFSMLGYYLPIMCLVSFAAEDMEVERSRAAYLLTVFGFFNTLGRFASGPIAMIPHFSALRVHNVLLFTAGILTILAAYAYNFTTSALYAGLCGFAIAPHMSLLPSVICDCVGLDRYTTAFGILFLFRGVTSIVGPPAAGFIKDYTKKYNVAFMIGGTMIAIAAFFHFALAFVEPDREVDAHDDDEDLDKNRRVDV